MTNILLLVLGLMIGLIIQGLIDFKALDDLEQDVDDLEDQVMDFLQRQQDKE